MLPIKRILCPVDFSSHSRHAMDFAVALAHHYDASITALYVVPPVVSLIPAGVTTIYPQLAFTPADIEELRRDLRQFGEEGFRGSLDAVVLEGTPGRTISAIAERLPADLVVIGSHGRSGFDRLILGSVTEWVVRHTRCPVITVPPAAAQAVPIGPIPFHRVVCAIDFSPASSRALGLATTMVGPTADVLAAHVAEFIPALEPVAAGPVERDALVPLAVVAGRRQLHAAVLQDAHAGRPPAEVVLTGSPSREILRLAGERHADLIVIGAHGRGSGLGALGSTTNDVLRHAPCPVLSLTA